MNDSQQQQYKEPVIKVSNAEEDGTRFYDGHSGVTLDRADFLARAADFQRGVLLVGENHEDPAAHRLELNLLTALIQKAKNSPMLKDTKQEQQQYSINETLSSLPNHSLALSLEFYDREAQTVLDEYLKGFVDVDTFLQNARPPHNHADYQPLIDYCKANAVPVIAANCPRRYSRMVSKGGGRRGLEECSMTVAATAANLPPLPYAEASDQYKRAFAEIMGVLNHNDDSVPTSLLDAQCLWDASMADSIMKVSSSQCYWLQTTIFNG